MDGVTGIVKAKLVKAVTVDGQPCLYYYVLRRYVYVRVIVAPGPESLPPPPDPRQNCYRQLRPSFVLKLGVIFFAPDVVCRSSTQHVCVTASDSK